MRLEDQRKLSHSDCHICRWARSKAVVWFLELNEDRNPYHFGSFRVFTKSNRTQGLPSKHSTVNICDEHWLYALADWIGVAQEELNLAIAFDAWAERVEQ